MARDSALIEIEESFYQEDSEQPIPPENVVAYNELRSCADLNRMYAGGNGKLELQPDFQREVVWSRPDQARFIDSLVKQLPIPSMCFSLDAKTQKWKVIDGLQRMSTITRFLGTADWRVADIEDIHPLLKGKTNNSLKIGTQAERDIYASVEDISIPITVLRCDYSNDSHTRYLFTIFNRLNSGGVRLNNQEIRNCIYSGQFNDALKLFDRTDKNWAIVKKHIWGPTDRFRSVEVALRALAFAANRTAYEGNLAGYLNNFMQKAAKANAETTENVIEELRETAVNAVIGLNALGRSKKSLTLIEAILVGILVNLAVIRAQNDKTAYVAGKTRGLLHADEFAVGARYALSSAQKVKDRLATAVRIYSGA